MKNAELQSVETVYGPLDGVEVVEGESPDFVLKNGGQPALGIEVTEFFFSESEARSQRIPGYALRILKTGEYVHIDDVEKLARQEIVYYPGGDESKGRRILAVVHEERTALDVNNRFVRQLEQKSAKVRRYLSAAPMVDLVITDPSNQLRENSTKAIYDNIMTTKLKSALASSQFREVSIVVKLRDELRVMPLKASMFVGTMLHLEKEYKAHYGVPSDKAEA